MYEKKYYSSPLGELLIAGDEEGIIGVWFEGQKYIEKTMPKNMILSEKSGILKEAADWLDAYFQGKRPDPGSLSLHPAGTSFQHLIWNLLLKIPYGEIVTYGELAGKAAEILGREKMSAQAVGGAVGHNPISVIIPCHRVVGADGRLTGYAGGLKRKEMLLRHEQNGNAFSQDGKNMLY